MPKYIYLIKIKVDKEIIEDVVELNQYLQFDRDLVTAYGDKHKVKTNNIILLGYQRLTKEMYDDYQESISSATGDN